MGRRAATPPLHSARRPTLSLGGCASSGWSEGGNLTIEYRWADGRTDHLPELAAESRRAQSRCHRGFGHPNGPCGQTRDVDHNRSCSRPRATSFCTHKCCCTCSRRLMAHNGHPNALSRCPLSGEYRTSFELSVRSAYDPLLPRTGCLPCDRLFPFPAFLGYPTITSFRS